ncbi:MAG: cation-transporting P-type ATPase, partial [Oceanipulchritudo sp.]
MAGARKEEQNFHAHKVSWARERLNVDPEQGLDPDEAEDRLKRHGPNELESFGLSNPLRILAQQFKSVVILVLAAAAVPAVAFGQWPEAIAIAAVVLVNTGLGFLSEWKATQTIQALKVQEAAE